MKALPWLIGASLVGFFLFNKNSSGSAATTSTPTTNAQPLYGVTVPASLLPLPARDLTVARGFIAGTLVLNGQPVHTIDNPDLSLSYLRRDFLQRVFDAWAARGGRSTWPTLMTVLNNV